MSMFCNVMMLLLLCVHVCVTRTDWKTRPRPKTVILSIKQSINQSIYLPPSFSLFVMMSDNNNDDGGDDDAVNNDDHSDNDGNAIQLQCLFRISFAASSALWMRMLNRYLKIETFFNLDQRKPM